MAILLCQGRAIALEPAPENHSGAVESQPLIAVIIDDLGNSVWRYEDCPGESVLGQIIFREKLVPEHLARRHRLELVIGHVERSVSDNPQLLRHWRSHLSI